MLGNNSQKLKLKENIINHTHTLIYGLHGIGKSYAVHEAIHNLGLREMISYPLEQEDLVRDFGVAHSVPNKVVFVIEADSLSKRTYGIITQILKSAENPFVFIALSQNSLHANLVKKLDCIKFFPPSYEEVSYFLKKTYNWDGDIAEIYDRDFRVVRRRVIYGINYNLTLKEESEIPAEKLAFDIIRGTAKIEDFENYDKPFDWILKWIAYNSKKFFPYKKDKLLENLGDISWIGSQVYFNSKPSLFQKGMMLESNNSRRMGRLIFPPLPYKDKKVKIEKISKIKRKISKLKNIIIQKTLDEVLEI